MRCLAAFWCFSFPQSLSTRFSDSLPRFAFSAIFFAELPTSVPSFATFEISDTLSAILATSATSSTKPRVLPRALAARFPHMATSRQALQPRPKSSFAWKAFHLTRGQFRSQLQSHSLPFRHLAAYRLTPTCRLSRHPTLGPSQCEFPTRFHSHLAISRSALSCRRSQRVHAGSNLLHGLARTYAYRLGPSTNPAGSRLSQVPVSRSR